MPVDPLVPLKEPGTVVTSGPGQTPSKERTWLLSSQEVMTSGKLSNRTDSPEFVSDLSASHAEKNLNTKQKNRAI